MSIFNDIPLTAPEGTSDDVAALVGHLNDPVIRTAYEINHNPAAEYREDIEETAKQVTAALAGGRTDPKFPAWHLSRMTLVTQDFARKDPADGDAFVGTLLRLHAMDLRVRALEEAG